MVSVAGVPKKKPDGGKLKGRTARLDEQRAIREVCRKFMITSKEDQRKFHDAITGKGLNYAGLLEAAKDFLRATSEKTS